MECQICMDQCEINLPVHVVYCRHFASSDIWSNFEGFWIHIPYIYNKYYKWSHKQIVWTPCGLGWIFEGSLNALLCEFCLVVQATLFDLLFPFWQSSSLQGKASIGWEQKFLMHWNYCVCTKKAHPKGFTFCCQTDSPVRNLMAWPNQNRA